MVVHEKLDIPEPFHKHHTHEFGGESGDPPPPFPRKKSSTVAFSSESRTRITRLSEPPNCQNNSYVPHFHNSMQILSNYKKWGGAYILLIA